MPLHIVFSDFVNEMNFPGLNMVCEQLHLGYLLRLKNLLDVLVLSLPQNLGKSHVALAAVRTERFPCGCTGETWIRLRVGGDRARVGMA